ncbi:MAG: 50S ribosomal protein L11 methyltransferase, partial [Candidatus Marinimicrobia bacterium]|nr:50S ribosomal protein L11 methyltransferase [Candidatus Neomarinimicrobiota bacterium]
TNKIWLRYEFPKGIYDHEILVALLTDTPCLGLIEKDNVIDAYFNADDENSVAHQLQEIVRFFPGTTIEYSKTFVQNQDWHLNWQDYFKPIRVSPGIAIYPYWEKYHGPEPIQIAIIPGMAFGTGTHATTQMALKLLEKTIRPGMTILDAGCGGGILSIAALKLGAGFVDAWDIDPDIEGNFREQLELNGIRDRFKLTIGDVTQRTDYNYNLVLSNIERKPNLALLQNIDKHGKVPPCIFTGILKDEYAIFKANVLNYGRVFKDEMFQDEWAALATE